MINNVKKVNELVAEVLKIFNEIEDITMDVVTDDDFQKTSDDFQDAIYFLNNYALENVNLNDLIES